MHTPGTLTTIRFHAAPSGITGPGFSIFKPVLKLVLNGGLVMVLWGRLGHSAFLTMLEICVDRGDGSGFVMLAYDTTPGNLDTHPLPAAAQKWT